MFSLSLRQPLAAALILLALGGCAAVPTGGDDADLRRLVAEHGGLRLPPPDTDTQARVAELLAWPLDGPRAVAVALLRNPALRAEYARLGLAQADVLDASRLSNPTLSLAALQPQRSGEVLRLDYGLVQNFTDLLFLRSRQRLAGEALQRTRLEAGARIQSLAFEVDAARLRLAAALRSAAMRERAAQAAETSAALAQRFHDAGNLDLLALRREQAAATQARLDADAATSDAAIDRSALQRLLGLRDDEAWQADRALPLPATSEAPLDALQRQAAAQRLDLAALRRNLDAIAQAQSLAARWRWLPLLEVGVQGERDSDGSHLIGPSLVLQLPLFNRGEAARARLQALDQQAHADLAAQELVAAGEVRDALARVQSMRRRVSRYREALLPQREDVVAQLQTRQNYMLIGQFEVLQARQQQFEGYQAYLDALRDYGLARIDLARATGAALPDEAAATTAEPDLPPIP
ncbi:MAG: TolC family protein [Nevskiaceae bacterium]|nr:MAG: TolC family protein [Nevskiaceae bacterium]